MIGERPQPEGRRVRAQESGGVREGIRHRQADVAKTIVRRPARALGRTRGGGRRSWQWMRVTAGLVDRELARNKHWDDGARREKTVRMTTIIAWWGAGLSTVLAVMTLFEFWRRRFRIEADPCLRGHPEEGNTILVRNLSGYPVVLTYWELIWSSKSWPRLEPSRCMQPEDPRDMPIAAGSSRALEFEGQDHFRWDSKALAGRRIYLRLHFAGKRAVLREVCR